MKVTRIFALAVLLLVVLVVVPTASPVQLSYVYSDSMEPTIPEGSGYILVPAGDVETGEIVAFYAETRNEYVTHRVVAVTEEGFITKGDNNPVTDQEAGLPPVDRSQIIGQVLVVAGDPVTLPHLGAVSIWMRTYWPLLIGGSFLYAMLGRQGESKRPRRSVLLTKDVLRPAIVGIALMGIVFIILSSSHASTIYLATASGIGGSNTLPVGETVTRNATVTITKTPLTRPVLTTDGMTVVNRTSTATRSRLFGLVVHRTVNLTLAINAPPAPGPVRTAIHIYSYPRTLPHGVVRALTTMHPILGGLGTVLAGLSPLLGICWLFVDSAHPVRLPRSKWIRRYFEEEDI